MPERERILFWVAVIGLPVAKIGTVAGVVSVLQGRTPSTPPPTPSPTSSPPTPLPIETTITPNPTAAAKQRLAPMQPPMQPPMDPPTPQFSSQAASVETALGSFYDEANGINWEIQTNWKSSEVSVCYWHGVVCDGDGKVTRIDLKNNNVYGSISTSIGLLTDLVFIDLDSNYLTGRIPTELGLLKSLRHFEADDNRLTGAVPSELGSLRDLKEVYVQTNNLSGTMPMELCARRIEKGGELDTLIADCLGDGNPFGNSDITCGCCSMCF